MSSGRKRPSLLFALAAAGIGAFLLTRALDKSGASGAKPENRPAPRKAPPARPLPPAYTGRPANDNRAPQKDAAPDIKITITGIAAEDAAGGRTQFQAVGKPLLQALSGALTRGEVKNVYVEGVSNKGQRYRLMLDPRDPKDGNMMALLLVGRTYHISDHGTGFGVTPINEGPYRPAGHSTHVLKR